MPASPAPDRQFLTRRTITCEGHGRDDGLVDVEGRLIDVRGFQISNQWRGTVPAGGHIHDMWIRLTIDTTLRIHAIEARTDHAPYPTCPDIVPNLQRLVGLEVVGGFKREVRARIGGTQGCTHLLTLIEALAGVAIQSIAASRRDQGREIAMATFGARDRGKAPLIDTCHSYAADGPIVAVLWPEHATPAAAPRVERAAPAAAPAVQRAPARDPRERVWFITGVSSGLGRELAVAALARGDRVAGTLRNPAQVAAFEALAPGRAHASVLDVTDAAAIPIVIDAVVARWGRIDVLVNNAGYGLIGATEEVADAEARRALDTNFFGALDVIRAALPHLRRARSGHIINISSIAGVRGVPGASLYCAAKHAVSGMSEALAAELRPLGIQVTAVEPGGFRTEFAAGSIAVAARSIGDYSETPAGWIRASVGKGSGREPGDPARAAQAVLQLVDSEHPPVHLLLGTDALRAAREKLLRLGQEYDTWESLSHSTNVA